MASDLRRLGRAVDLYAVCPHWPAPRTGTTRLPEEAASWSRRYKLNAERLAGGDPGRVCGW